MIINIEKEEIKELIAAVYGIHRLSIDSLYDVAVDYDEIYNVYNYLYNLYSKNNRIIDDYYFDSIVFSNISENDKYTLLFEDNHITRN